MYIRSQLARQGVRNGIAASAYITLIALFLFHVPKTLQNPGWLGPAMGLMLFVVSALITGSLVLWSPLKLLADNKKQEAGALLGVTGGTLVVVLALLVVATLLFR